MTFPLICVLLVILLVIRDLMARRAERRLRADTKRLKEGLKDTDRLANVGRLVSGLAQELKSPLQGVLGNAEVLAATGSSGTDAQELHELRENVTRAVGIVRNLLVFTEANSLNRRWHNLNELVSAAVDSRRTERRLPVSASASKAPHGCRSYTSMAGNWSASSRRCSTDGRKAAAPARPQRWSSPRSDGRRTNALSSASTIPRRPSTRTMRPGPAISMPAVACSKRTAERSRSNGCRPAGLLSPGIACYRRRCVGSVAT